jgi:hypothetical protein
MYTPVHLRPSGRVDVEEKIPRATPEFLSAHVSFPTVLNDAKPNLPQKAKEVGVVQRRTMSPEIDCLQMLANTGQTAVSTLFSDPLE